MNIRKTTLLGCWCLAGALLAAARPDWTRYVIFPEGADYAVESVSPSAFTLRARRTDAGVVKTGALAISNIRREMWTHNKVALCIRSLNGKRVGVNVALSFPDARGRIVMKSVDLDVAGRAWRDVVLGLDHDYGLGDRSIRIEQAKIGAWVSAWKGGEEGGIEVKDFRLCGPDEVSLPTTFGAQDTFLSVPAANRAPPAAPRADALRVFFAFDNEDVIASVHTRKPGLRDAQQFAGFRAILLEPLDGAATVATNLAAADVIVYSRCRPDPALAAQIAEAVTARGVPLYAASEVCDPAVERLLPCTLGHEVLEDLPPRACVRAAAVGHPLAAGGDLSTAPFGIYRKIAPKPGAQVVLAFADGTPALVEGAAGKGRVLYNMLAVGSSLVPDRAAPDAFFVRALGYLGHRALPERPRARAVPDAEGWYAGVGAGSFGRFGWETGNGLLVEDVGTRFTVRCGDAGYAFGFPCTDAERARGRAFTFAGDRVNPLCLGGTLAVDGRRVARVDCSLGYPGVRWAFACDHVELYLKNLLARAAVSVRGCPRVVDVAEGGAIPPPAAWTAPWLLAYNGTERDAPLLLVFERRLDDVAVMRAGEAVRGLALASRAGGVGMVTPTWLYGSARVDTTAWTNGVPADALARIARWHPRALRYPVDCTERFKLRADKGRVVVKATYAFAETQDAWRTPARPYAPVPPVAYALADARPEHPERLNARMKGPVVAVPASVAERALVTRYGPFADKDGAASVQWALPLLAPDLGFLPHAAGFPECEKIANDQFASGVRFTCGGGVKVDPVGDKRGGARHAGVYNLNMHGSLLGLCRCTPNPFIYSAENRRLMRRRMTWRMLEPLETMNYKMACRWRKEPVSGSVYTIYMNSPRDIATRFAPETYGSKIIYGDSNETVRMILTCLQILEDRWGQRGVVRANWDAITRHVASYEMCLDDWAFGASGCLECGGSGSIDMLNSEYSCMMKLARLAEIAGDEAVRAQALYRAARRVCPTLARLKMRAYHARTGQLAAPEKVRAATGFNEHGASFQPRARRVQDIDLFDMSQGIPQDLIALYQWYGWRELRADYVDVVRDADAAQGLDYITLAILAIASDLPDEALRAKLAACAADAKLNARLPKDWPGMDTGSYLAFTLARLAQAPRIADCRGLAMHDARWDPATRRLVLDYTPGPEARLAVASGNRRIDCPVAPAGVRRTETLAW